MSNNHDCHEPVGSPAKPRAIHRVARACIGLLLGALWVPLACEDTSAKVCEECDGDTEYCHERITDGPSHFSCREIPEECNDDISCACVESLACPELSQACHDRTVLKVECIEG